MFCDEVLLSLAQSVELGEGVVERVSCGLELAARPVDRVLPPTARALELREPRLGVRERRACALGRGVCVGATLRQLLELARDALEAGARLRRVGTHLVGALGQAPNRLELFGDGGVALLERRCVCEELLGGRAVHALSLAFRGKVDRGS